MTLDDVIFAAELVLATYTPDKLLRLYERDPRFVNTRSYDELVLCVAFWAVRMDTPPEDVVRKLFLLSVPEALKRLANENP